MPKATGREHILDAIVISGPAGLAAGLRACERGIDVIAGSGDIKGIEKQAQSPQVTYTHQDQEHTIPYQAVILSVGWPAHTEKLN
jgi:thioredoxin reductase